MPTISALRVALVPDTSALAAGFASARTEAQAAGQAAAEAFSQGTAATAAATAEQGRYNSALRQTLAQLAALKGDSLGALKTSFSGVSDADLGKLAALKGELAGVKAGLAEEAGAARAAEAAIAAAGKEGVATFRLQARALKDAEAEWTRYAATVEKSSAATGKKLASAAAADAKKAAGPGFVGAISSAPVQHLADTGLMAGAGIGVALGVAVKQAADFDTAMRNVNSIAQLGEKDFQDLRKSVLGLTNDPAILAGPKELAKGLYDVVSSGFSGKKALEILAVSAKGATAGMTDTATASKVLMAVLNSGIPGVHSTRQAMDLLFQEVNLGVNTFEGLANSIGIVLPVAKIAGVSLQEVTASLAALTRRGLSIDEASTALSQFFNHLINPGKQGVKILDELGIAHGIAGVKARGFTHILDDMAHMTEVQKQKLVEALPEMRSLRAMLTLTDEKGKSYIDMLKGAAQATEGVGQTTKAQNEQLKGAGASFKGLAKDVEKLGVDIGDSLLPQLKKAVAGLDGLVKAFGKLAPGQQDAIVKGAEYSAFFLIIVSGAAKAVKAVGELATAFKVLGGGSAAAGAAGATASGGGLLSRFGALFTGGALSGLTPKVDTTGSIIRNLGLDKRFPALFGDYGEAPDIRATKEVSEAQLQAAGVGSLPGTHPGAVTPGGGPRPEPIDHAKITAAQKESIKAGQEIGRLSKEIAALHGGHTKAVGDLEAKYSTLNPAIRKYIEHLTQVRDAEVKAHAAKLKLADAIKKEGEHFAEAMKEAKSHLADLHAQYGDQPKPEQKATVQGGVLTMGSFDAGKMAGGFLTLGSVQATVKDGFLTMSGASIKATVSLAAHQEAIDKLTKAYPHHTRAQIENLAQTQLQAPALKKAHEEAEKHVEALRHVSDATRELGSSLADIGERLPVHAAAVKFFKEQFEQLPPPLQQAATAFAQLTAEGGSLRKFIDQVHQASAAMTETNNPFSVQSTAVKMLGQSYDDLTAGEKRWTGIAAEMNRVMAERNLLFQAQAGYAKGRAEMGGDRMAAMRAEHPGMSDDTLQSMLGAQDFQKRAGAVAAAEQNGIQQPQFTNPFADEINRQYARAGELTKGATIGGRSLTVEEQMQAFQHQLSGPALAAYKKQFGDADQPDTTKDQLKKQEQYFAILKSQAEAEKNAWMQNQEYFFKQIQKGFSEAAKAFGSAADKFSKDMNSVVGALRETIAQIGQNASVALSGLGSGAVAGHRASGGDVYGGSSYLVGERGPELFVPGASGAIVPNNALGGGGDIHVSMNIVTPNAASFHQSRHQITQDAHRMAEHVRSRNG